MRSRRKYAFLGILLLLFMAATPQSVWAQGSIFGTVQNSDLSVPANGEITFFGYLDNTDEEIRVETSTGAGYDNGNWFDDFQNYLTEAPGNPYDYHFYNVANGEAFQLSKAIPNNSFQQENIVLAVATWPVKPAGLTAIPVSGTSVVLEWTSLAGHTYHIYRRPATSSGSFFRIDDPTGSLANPGVSGGYYVDNGVAAGISYNYVIVAEDGAQQLSPHSDIITASTAAIIAPVIDSILPASGLSIGGTPVTIYGSNLDMNGVSALVGANALTGVTVTSPYQLTGTTQASAAGPADVTVTNIASGQTSNTLTGAFTYSANSTPVLVAIGPQTVTEGGLLSFVATATDADLTPPVMTSSTLPGAATYTDNGDGTASFSWQTDYISSGVYNVTFYATDAVTATLVDSEVVTITVNEAGNQLPVLAAIGAQSTTENVQLAFTVNATDVESTPVLTTTALPTGASFVDNNNGSGDFTWTPDFTQAGSYTVTFYAADDSSAVDSEVVTITVNDAGNQAPVLAAIGPQAGSESVQLTFGVSATDPDTEIPALTTSALPTGAVFTDNSDGTGTFDWTPGFTQAGSYNVTFYATDLGGLQDSEVVTITINDAGNQPPVLAAIGDRATDENVQLNFTITATDPESTPLFLTSTPLPTGAVFTDNLDGTATFDWTPTYSDSGSYPIIFFATDGFLLDSEVVVITVNNVNRDPVLAAIGSQATDENVQLTFGVSAIDPDNNVPVLTTSALPTGAVFTDNIDGTGTFNWTPSYADSGVYQVTFYATDGGVPTSVDSEVVTITVNNVNQLPVLAAIGAQTALESTLLAFTVTATDGDAEIPILTTSALPGTATFVDNGNGTGDFAWTPAASDAGIYSVIFYATDAAFPTVIDSEVVSITVTDVNQPPVLAAIGPQTTTEGIQLLLNVSATDVDGATPSLVVDSLPLGATFVDSANGVGTFDWTPGYMDAGTYNVIFIASDGLAADSEIVTITVNDAGNQPPSIDSIGTRLVAEGNRLLINMTVQDPDNVPVLSTSALPTGALFTDNGDATGTFDWTPTFSQSGNYSVTFFANDGITTDSEVVSIVVTEQGNQPPVFVAQPDTTVLEGGVLVLNISATDPEGGTIRLTVNTSMDHYTFVDNRNGTGVFTYTPDYKDAGIDTVRFFATDNATPPLTGIDAVRIQTVDVNQPPTILPVGPFGVDVNDSLIFTVTAVDSSDVDGGRIFLSADNIPANATFMDNTNNTGTFRFRPVLGQEGVDTVTILATDDDFPPTTAELNVIITVRAINQAPVLASIGAKTVLEGATLTINLSATDPDAGPQPLFYPIDSMKLPANSNLVDNGNGTAVFTFTPSFLQAGLYSVKFVVSDGNKIDKETILIQVYEAGNQTPAFDPFPIDSVVEGQTLTDVISATDPDANPVTISLDPAATPANFSLTDNGDGTAGFTFSPDFTQAGTANIGVIVSDGSLADTATLVVEVIEAGNQLPVLAAIADQSTRELVNLNFSISASDPDGDIPVLSADLTVLPSASNPTFTDNSDGTGTFNWTPSSLDSGTYNVWFYAVDGVDPAFVDSQSIVLTVADTNRTPNFFVSPFYADSILEGDTTTINMLAWDVDLTIPSILPIVNGVQQLLPNMTLTDTVVSGGGSAPDTVKATYRFVPSFNQGDQNPSRYFVRFIFVDQIDPTRVDTSATRTIDVYPRNFPPVIAFTPSAGPFTISEGDSLNIRATASDPDGSTLATIAADQLPPNATATPGLPNQVTVIFKPSFTQAGSYQIRFIATDVGGAKDTALVDITVQEAGNQAPTFTTVLPDTINAFIGVNWGSAVNATDLEGDSVAITAEFPATMVNATFGQTGVGSGYFSYTPDITELSTTNLVRFIATDFPGGATDTLITHFVVNAFMRGDVDANQQYDVTDIVVIVSYLFRNGAAPQPLEAADVDLSGSINAADAAYLINYLYKAGPRPPQ